MMNPNARASWDERYATDDYIFGTAPNAFLAAQKARLTPGQRALAIADGEGRNGVWLAEQGLDVTAIELSPVAIAKAQKLAAERGASTYHVTEASILTWPWPQAAFDVVAAIFIQFIGPAEREIIFQRIVATLKPGGLLIMQGYRPEQLNYKTGGPPVAENMYSEAMLRDAFASLNILHLSSHDSEIAEGAGHKGLSALIDLVAQKPA